MKRPRQVAIVLVVCFVLAATLLGCGSTTPAEPTQPAAPAQPAQPVAGPAGTSATPAAAPKAPSSSAAPAKMPSMIGVSSYTSGSKSYSVLAPIARAIEVKSGMKVKVVPAGTVTSRAMAVIRGEVLLSLGYEPQFYTMQGGIWDFSEQGPQEFAMVFGGYPGGSILIARGDSRIKTFADMKGKKVAYYKDYEPTAHNYMTSYLAFGGLTWDDVVPYPTNYAKGLDAIVEGTADVANASPGAAQVYKLGSSVHGVQYIGFPASDTAGWQRLQENSPYEAPGLMTVGFSLSEKNPVPGAVYPAAIYSRADANEDVIYAVAKAVIGGYDIYKDGHPEDAFWTVDQAVDLELLNAAGFPYHPGAVRAFKEAGKWTPRHDKWQQSRREFAPLVKKVYSETVDEAVAKNVALGSADFQKAWEPKWQKIRSELVKTKY